MSLKSGQTVTIDFTVTDSDGALSDADSLPTGTLVIGGVDDAATVTITNKATGRYKAAVTLPTLTAGDAVDLFLALTIGGVATGDIRHVGVVDTKRVSDLNDIAAGEAMTLTSAYDAAKTAATQASVDDLPTNAELTAAIAEMNDLSPAEAQAAALAALNAYDPPTKAEIDAKFASTVLVSAPVATNGDITIYQGDDYTIAESRAIEFAIVTELTLVSVALKLQEATWTGILTANDDGYLAQVELTAEQTAALTRPPQSYELEAVTDAGSVVTLQTGTCTVKRDIPVVGA